MTQALVYTCDGCDEQLKINQEYLSINELHKYRDRIGWKFCLSVTTIGCFDLCEICYRRWLEMANPKKWARAVAPKSEVEFDGFVFTETESSELPVIQDARI